MDMLFVTRSVSIPKWEFEFSASRSSGPGGQAVNKTSSRVTLRWNVERTQALSPTQRRRVQAKLGNRIDKAGWLQIHAEDSRSQWTNREVAVQKLCRLLKEALHVERPRRPTRPTRASKARRVAAKKQKGQTKRLRGKPSLDD